MSQREDDPYLWLEDVEGERALGWVRERNAVAQGELEAAPGFGALRDRLRRIYDSKEKIPWPEVLGAWIYNVWKDEEHPRGLWRRTTLEEFRKPTPAWEVVLDLDALARAEGENWVWQGADCLYPDYERCLLRLSRGGADASVVREFDTRAKSFVTRGFELPEAKSTVSWIDRDTITVGTDFGPGSMTESGYPRIAKEWKRGEPLGAARTIFEGRAEDIYVWAHREFDHGHVRDWVGRAPTFFTNELWLREGGRLERIEKPDDADADTWDRWLLIRLRTEWAAGGTTWPAGALLAAPLDEFRAGRREFSLLFEPRPNAAFESYAGTKSAILAVELEDVKSRVYLHVPGPRGFSRRPVEAPAVGSFIARAYDEDVSDDYWFIDSGFTTPTTLSLGSVSRAAREPLKSNPAFFDAAGIEVEQHFARSKDGTRVPYFQVGKPRGAGAGPAPTVLEGYGGFEVSLTPAYDPAAGAGWLERGGVLAVANIRGGGEYGPAWHRAALKHDRQRAYDDFIAVAEDLIARGVTAPSRLGIVGGSNGGLLVGVMLTQRPELFGAVVCRVPLLDMRRYHELLAGASWVEEYGNPEDAADWGVLAAFSPYQNVRRGVRYPRVLFTTSTRDDRVHPGHARKMVARMLEQEHDLLYYENIEGGHGGAADNEQRAYMDALVWTFFARQLGLG